MLVGQGQHHRGERLQSWRGRYKPQVGEKPPEEDPAELISKTLRLEREHCSGPGEAAKGSGAIVKQPVAVPVPDIARLIHSLRDQRVILDSDLARI